MTFQSGFAHQPTNSATISSAKPIALSYTSNLYQSVAMSVLGQSVIEEDATKLPVLSSMNNVTRIIKNDGGYPVGYRDNTGTLIMSIAPGGVLYAALKDNSTPAGTWSVTGTNLEPGLITLDATLGSTFTSTVLATFVALDNNTSIHFATIASGFVAFIVDNLGKVLTTPVTVSATASMKPVQAFKINSTQAIVFITDGSVNSNAGVLTINGTSPNLTLSVGAFTSGTGGAGWFTEDFVGVPKIVQLSPLLYLASYTTAVPSTTVSAIAVSGTTVTVGTAVNLVASSTVANSTLAYPLTATTALVLYQSAATYTAVVVTLAGTVCTLGTALAVITLPSSNYVPSTCQLSATKVLCGFSTVQSNPSAVVAALTIAGAVVSVGATLTLETAIAGSDVGVFAYTASAATRYNPHLFSISTTNALFWYVDSNGISRVVGLVENGGAVTAGSILYRSISAGTISITLGGQIMPQGLSEFIAIRQDGITNAFKFRAVPHKLSGSNITTGAVASLDTLPLKLDFTAPPTMYRLASGDYVITSSASGNSSVMAMPVFRSNGDAINYRGSINVPSISGFGSPLPSVATNRVVFIGGTTNDSTTVGVSTSQLRLLNVEIAA